MQVKNKRSWLQSLLRKRPNFKKNSVKILLLMLTEIISRLLPKQKKKLLNSKQCLLPERLQLSKRFKCTKRNSLENQLYLRNLLSKKRMMVISKLLKR
jgi:hypothetical protein